MMDSSFDTDLGIMTRSQSRSSLRSSIRASKMKIDEFFKSPSLDFGKRKRYVIEQLPAEQLSDTATTENEEPSRKRRPSICKIKSVAQLWTPIKSVLKAGNSMQKSFSVRNIATPVGTPKQQCHTATPYKRPGAPYAPSPLRRMSSAYWHETADNIGMSRMTRLEIQRQEAIFELYKSEVDLIDDINMIKTTYDDSMRKLSLMSDIERKQLFEPLYQLLPVHEELVEALRDQRMPDGTTDYIGQAIVDWVPKLQVYVSYCSSQVYVKSLLDTKKLEPAVDDFLQRCINSTFSRRLDLWSLLDLPRSRLVKYPLMLKNIQKHTPLSHVDYKLLDEAISAVEQLITDVDYQAGISKCAFTISRLDYVDERQKHPLINQSRFILCEGILRSSRGVKLNVILLDLILVLTRSSSRGDVERYQVYRQPIPVSQLIVQDNSKSRSNAASATAAACQSAANTSTSSLSSINVVRRGSFRNAFAPPVANNSFTISANGQPTQTYTLLANDELDKRHWLQQLQTAVQSQTSINHQVPPTAISEPVASARGRRCSGVTVGIDSRMYDANASVISLTSYNSLSSCCSSSSAMSNVVSEASFHLYDDTVSGKSKTSRSQWHSSVDVNPEN